MTYPFPSVERSVYPKTFLKDVRLVADFQKVDQNSIDKARLNSFFSQFNGAEVDVDKIENGIELRSQDDKIRLQFSLDRVSIQLRQPFYKKFEQAEEFLSVMENYFNNFSIKEVKKVTVSKFNELGFHKDSHDFPIKTVMQGVFSGSLLEKVGLGEENFDDMVRWEKAISLDGSTETKTMFYAECGFCITEKNSNDGSLTLTTRIESTASVAANKILDTAKEYNQILDNAFHWCVNKSIIEKMKGHE